VAFCDVPGFARVVESRDVLARQADLSIAKHVEKLEAKDSKSGQSLAAAWTTFEESGQAFWQDMEALVEMLDKVADDGAKDA
jgi:type I restriction enzyme M protein